MSQSDEETALIRGVVANPDDDGPRLVYADWLEEHGQEPRARLIRVQCQLECLKAEERELITQYGRQWASKLFAAGGDAWRFHRGFPEEVSLSFVDYLKDHAHLNNITPLSRLHLRGGTDEHLRQLAALPAAAQIRSLELDEPSQGPNDRWHGVAGIRSLADSPYLRGLRRLTLHSHNFGVEGMDVIAGSPTFANLTHLTLSDPALRGVGPESGLRLINAPHLSGLVELTVGLSPPERGLNDHALRIMRRIRPESTRGNGSTV